MRTLSFPLLVLTLVSVPIPARAQTSDALFGGWTWRPSDQGSRPAGLAGAYVAVADGARTAAVNPAGLSLIPKLELAASTAPLWFGIARRIDNSNPLPAPVRPTEPGVPVPCPPGRRARPWAAGLYVEQAETQQRPLEVIHGPGLSEQGLLEARVEELGAALAKGLTPWLDVGVGVAWRHLQLDGTSTVVDLRGDAQQRLTLGGDSNKARAVVGALASFGPSHAPTAIRLGIAYRRDLMDWSVQRSRLDFVNGAVSPTTEVRFVEPATLAAGFAWRMSDAWLVAGQVTYTWFDRVTRALEEGGGTFTIPNHLEPRAAVEMTRSSPIGGYYKVRAGVRREISGQASFEGDDPVLTQAFRATGPVARASFGLSQLAEFYDHGVRLDLDISQVVLERRTTLSAAGTRRFSIGLTVRL